MDTYIVAVHMVGGTQHEHISQVIWAYSNFKSGRCSTADMVGAINQGAVVKVSDGSKAVRVGVVSANPPYLRTYADDVYTDNLLQVTRY